MRYEISGTVMQTLAVDLDPGEVVFSQTNCMCWMNDGVEMNTSTGGGMVAGFLRSLSGGSFFITDFSARTAAAMSRSRHAFPARSCRSTSAPAKPA